MGCAAPKNQPKGSIKMKRLPGWQRVLALAFAGVFALSAAMAGTAAWAELSQHRTNIVSGEGPPKPTDALLQKYETDTENPVPGVHFALFRANPDGTAVLIDTFITGPDGQVLAMELEPGNYYWQETVPAPGFLPESEDGRAKKYFFSTPSGDGGPVRTVAYNTRQLAGLTVSKTVAGEGADLNREFSFTAVIGGKTEVFSLRHGHSIVFEDIPVGTAYEVIEMPAQGYVTSSVNNAGSVPAQGATAAFTNTYGQPAPGSLMVTKVVTGQGADPAKPFEFTAVVGGETQTFALTHGLSEYFENLPAGTQYSVAEKDYAGEGFATAQRTRGGTVTAAGGLVHLVYVNEYGPPDPDTGSLVVTKAVAGPGGRGRAFSFTAVIGGETETFTLKHGESKIFRGIPAGTAYAVTEDDYTGEGYAARFVPAGSDSGVVAGGQVHATACVNSLEDASRQLRVVKRVAGSPPARDAGKPFHFTLTINGAPHEFDLKQDETSQAFTVYPGDTYSLLERDYRAQGYTGTVNYGAGTVGGVDIEILQTNTYAAPETVDIEGEKTWQFSGPPEAVPLPAGVTILLKNGGATVGTAAAAAAGGWRYEFKNLPKHDALGNVIPYVVEEVRIPGWRPAVTGYDIKNYRQPPASGEAVEVEKKITGTPPAGTQSAFKFLLTPVNGAPMPTVNEITITGEGKAAFGAAAYPVAGMYIYTLTETPGNLANWSYDASVYTLTVTVSEDGDGQLAVSRTLTKAGQAADTALFVNHYSRVPETIDVRVTKAWQGAGEHPQSVRAQLYRDGTAYGAPATLSAANNWTRLWPGLDKGHAWTVDEADVPEGYTKSVSGDAVNGFTITNTKGAPPELTSVKVTKVWKGEDPDRPAGVVMQLYRDGAASGIPVTLSEGNGWTYTWAGLEKRPASPGGEPYAWTVDEVNVPAGYSKGVTGEAANGFVVTNTRLDTAQPPCGEVTLSGKKTWNHGDNPADRRPESITVIIKAEGAIVAQRMITAAEHWAWSFRLPKYDGEGKEIKYAVDEAGFEDYVKTVDGYNLINTYKPGGSTGGAGPGRPAAPKTDDENNPALWLALTALSFAALTFTVIPWKKMKGGRKHDT